ncbi:phenylacetyl-CoA ligase [Hypoxylon sp. NC1633]|nr:phenylacetyl-CoA ligase [Hypoxylon sp. NC1633]
MPLESPHAPLRIPDSDLCNFLFGRLENVPSDKVLFISDDGTDSYTASSLRKTASCFSEGLATHFGWRKGHVLALISANSVHIPAVILGGLLTGGIISPMNPAYGVHELVYQLRDSGASVIVTQKPFLPVVLEAAKIVNIPQNRIVVLPTDHVSPNSITENTVRFTDFISNQGHRSPQVSIDSEDDIAFLVYTSGTTGLPKGAEITHRNMVSNILMADMVNFVRSNDTVIAMLPFFHILGLMALVLHPVSKCARVVVMSQFTPVSFCQAIESWKATVAYIVPPVAALLCQLELPAKHNFTSIKYMISAGAPLSEDLIKTLYSRWRVKLLQCYGLTETSPGAFMMSPSDFPAGNGTVGQLLPNQQAKLLDIDDPTKEVRPGKKSGQVCIRGPNIFKGYHNNPAATKAAFTSDGFFLTGDVGTIDESGYLRITDRVKELIKYKGFQIAPAELEGLLMGHEGVLDVCVVGIQDDYLATEVPRAYVVRKPGWQPSNSGGVPSGRAAAEAIRSWIDGRVAYYKKLRGGVHFIESLPRTVSGKLLRKELKSIATKAKL